jgi:Flp pilus assembly protein TadG
MDQRRSERGQALALIAMSLVVLIGFVGLTIDGGRGYWERRILQNAVDAAALAASDNYQDTASTSSSMQAAASEYAANERISGAATASPAWTAATVDVTWAGSPDKLHIVAAVTGTIATFDVSSTHQLGLAFMSVLGTGPTINISGSAQGRAKTGGTSGAGLVTLNTGNCSGGLTSFSVGQATVNVLNGNVQINGSASTGTGTVKVPNGSFSTNCTASPPGVTASAGVKSGVAPVADPGFPAPSLTAYPTNQSVGTNVTLNPGIYAADIGGSANSCFFLAAGIYQLKGGFNATAGVWSNQLRAPDEPAWGAGTTNYLAAASPQWWGSSCAGSFSVSAVADALSLAAGNWGVMLTSTRKDYYPDQTAGGTAYARESAPSMCRSISVGVGQAVKVSVNNVPGATGYNVYMSYLATGTSACTGPWGYVGSIDNTVTETQTSRGTVSKTFNTSAITSLPLAANITKSCASGALVLNCAASTGQFGSANPPGDGAETAPRVISSGSYPPQPPDRDVPSAGGGDRGNEHNCVPAGTSSAAPCVNATVTPGAVVLYFPAGMCFSWTANATMRVFSGYQYNWMAIYAPLANTCTVHISDAASVIVNGTYYWPGGLLSLNGNAGYDIYFSQIITDRYETTGNETLFIGYDATSVAPQGFSQISR